MFINYRGEDSHSYGALLYTELSRKFGEDRVFLDCESIPAGADFVQELLDRVRSAQVLLAVIGHRWLTAFDSTDPTRRRLDDPNDWIRRELAEAFTAGVRVIPVLTEQTKLPDAVDLPADITALSRCQYRRLRYRDPTADLARIVADLTALGTTALSRTSVPRQLPAAPRLFVGRTTELATLTDAATTTPDVGATVVISAIGGAGGIGKTALALHWAYQHVEWFPDGQLYVNLRGFDPSGQPTPTGAAVRGFLDALGDDPSTLPVDLDARAARYRSLVAGKRMLIVLDNARDVDQVTPLLPGSPTCTVLVTSRRHLASLATLHGAHLVDLDVLPDHEAHDLLARHLGPPRLATAPDTVNELLALCGGLPLALSIVGARAQRHPDFPLGVLAEELREESERLDSFDAGDLHANLRRVLSGSYRALSRTTAGVFALLGLVPGQDVSLAAVASLTAFSVARTRVLLRELESASLVQQHAPDRYRMHDLIRLYASEQAAHGLSPTDRSAALRRLTDFYLHTAFAGQQLLAPVREPIELDPPAPGCRPQPLADMTAALAWLVTEHPGLLAVQRLAAMQGWHRIAWQLAWVLDSFQWRQGHLRNYDDCWRIALDAAEQLGDPAARMRTHWLLGQACAHIGNTDALDHLRQALALAEQMGDVKAQGWIHLTFAERLEHHGEIRQALTHVPAALRVFRRIDDKAAEGRALTVEGWLLALLGQYDQARDSCERALPMVRLHRLADDESSVLDTLGYITHRTGNYAHALDYYHQALNVRREIGNVYGIANILDHLGEAYASLGQHNDARNAWAETFDLYRTQNRAADAERVRQRLESIGHRPTIGYPARLWRTSSQRG